MTTQSSTGPSVGDQVANALKLVGNVAITPGVAQLVEGNVSEGILYGVVGFAAKAVVSSTFGPVLWLAVAADSYAKSVQGRHLWESAPSAASPSAAKEPVAP